MKTYVENDFFSKISALRGIKSICLWIKSLFYSHGQFEDLNTISEANFEKRNRMKIKLWRILKLTVFFAVFLTKNAVFFPHFSAFLKVNAA
jgi:hypothetical protein